MSIVRRFTAELRAVTQWGDSSIPPPGGWPSGNGAGGVTARGVLAIQTVLNCSKALCSDVSILPFAAYTGDKHGVKRILPVQPLIVSQPFGPDVPTKVGLKQIVLSLALRGRAFLYVAATDPATGYPTMVMVLNPDAVEVLRDPDTGRKWFRINGRRYSTAEVKHIIDVSYPGDLDGIDPVSYMASTFGMAQDRKGYGQAFFRNGTTPSGVISIPGQGDRRKAREVREAWEAGHAGVANAHRPAVLFGGGTWQQLSVNPDQAQFLGTGQFEREDICGWFGVPLQRIHATPNGNAPAGKGLDTIDQGYATHTLLPLTTAIEDVWDSMLPGGESTWTQFNFAGLLRAAALERAQIAQIHRLTGVRNRDEVRADEGWAPIGGPDGTDYNVPFNTNSAVPPLVGEPGTTPPTDPNAEEGTT